MARLDTDRQKDLEPKRINFGLKQLQDLGLEVVCVTSTRIDFIYKSNTIKFFPYSGWHTGKGIKDGRGWDKLKKQLI